MVRIKEITLDWFLGHLETVIELLKLPGVDVNAVDQNGNTPLHVAADKGIIFLGPRGPHGIPPLVRPLVSPSARKIWITYIQAYKPQESSEDSSNQPDGPMGPPKSSP